LANPVRVGAALRSVENCGGGVERESCRPPCCSVIVLCLRYVVVKPLMQIYIFTCPYENRTHLQDYSIVDMARKMPRFVGKCILQAISHHLM